ncbi:MAG TPA: serine hydrolase domain-containing protein [Chitinophagaceae bacterium]|nr:serine hydrolase domain-containing protein [Chitinophagaceae bacterium]
MNIIKHTLVKSTLAGAGVLFIVIACTGVGNIDTGNNLLAQRTDSLVNDYMAKYHVPGMSVAIAKDGEIIFAKGYGFADKETGEEVTPESLFRIASVSKPFTSVAIMQLIESGRLGIDDKAFGDSGILGNTYGHPPYKGNINNITIHQLLQHTCGGWSNNDDDPMFLDTSLTQSQVIAHTLDSLPLINEPGKVYAYSNFGYCVLGRVIEKVTGEKYADYVKKHILLPAGIADMQVGGNTLAERKPGEVVYYGQGGENPYEYNIARMDSHGGWIASATDLLKFVFETDSFTTHPDILQPAAITLMTTPSAANKNYACGWQVNSSYNWWHTGSLPGTATELVRAHNGYSWAILANTRALDKDFVADMDRLVWKAIRPTR